jgi:hypothetical protein
LLVPFRLPWFRYALIAALLGVVAGTAPASAEAVEPQEHSAQAALDSFVAYLKAETNEAITAAARLARDHKDSLDAARAYFDRHFTGWRAALSGHKAKVPTLDQDASAMWQAWREAAISSWATIERSAHNVVDWIATWMRRQSLSDQTPQTPV